MKYVLDKKYALRGWQGLQRTLCVLPVLDPQPLSKEEFALLTLCDGEHDIENGEALQKYIASGAVRAAKDGERTAKEQEYRFFDNRWFTGISVSITGRCNYNCRHCFMAKDENNSLGQLTKEECFKIIDESVECGIANLRITGGEPLLHPDFMEIALESQKRGLNVKEILTNGALITDDMLKKLRDGGLYPLMMISFDGIGRHDWMRGVKGAEEKALRAMELCSQNNLNTVAHICVSNANKDALLPTARLLSKMGVNVLRIIRVGEAPRWVKTSMEHSISPEEYYDALCGFMAEYKKEKLKPMVELWVDVMYYPMYDGRADFNGDVELSEEAVKKLPVCPDARTFLHISYDGGCYPCNERSGYMRMMGIDVPNIRTSSIYEMVTDSTVLGRVCQSVGDLFEANGECAACEYRLKCRGGCRAMAIGLKGIADSGELECDRMRCVFYKKGYYKRLKEILAD